MPASRRHTPVKPRSLFYWEAKRRLELLVAYRQKIVDYYERAEWDPSSGNWEDDEETSELRRQINEGMRKDLGPVRSTKVACGQCRVPLFSGSRSRPTCGARDVRRASGHGQARGEACRVSSSIN